MSEPTTERLYNLLPAIHRIRDVEQGEPLRTLLGVLESELTTLRKDIDGLYDDWFIETCAEWVVPYIGDLVGVRGLLPTPTTAGSTTFSQRGRVANALAQRRGKGTGAALEQLARDVTGWPARVVEFFELLATVQHANHVRPSSPATVDLRDVDGLELLAGPFERVTRTAEVRHVDNTRGKYDIPHLGIFVWRLQSYTMAGSTARAVLADTPAQQGRFHFGPLDFDEPLFNLPRSEQLITQVAGEENVPAPLRRRPLYDELEELRQALADGLTPRRVYFGTDPVVQVRLQLTPGGPLESVLPQEILICDLSDPPSPGLPEGWRRPPTSVTYRPTNGGSPVEQRIRVAVDPVLGRLALPVGVVPQRVEVDYAYGFSADLGGGPYNRRDSVASWLGPTAVLPLDRLFQVGVTQDPGLLAGASERIGSLHEAVALWNAQPPGSVGVIAILDNRTYVENLTGANEIVVPAGSRLLIVAADWPREVGPPGSGPGPRLPGRLAADRRRPHLLGDLAVRGSAPAETITLGSVCLNGLLIEGNVLVSPGNLAELRVSHSTVAPMAGTLTVQSPDPAQLASLPPAARAALRNERLEITVERSIVGPVRLTDTVRRLRLVESIADGSFGGGIAITASATGVDASTILGATVAESLDASNSIFTGAVGVERRQAGCVRFSYLPSHSLVPRRFRCQPADSAGAARVIPRFTSLNYGQPGYAQLAPACPSEISSGADDEGEMGAFQFLQQTQRIGSLRASLDEHLRFGLEAGVFLVT
jgi:hypothetical protein